MKRTAFALLLILTFNFSAVIITCQIVSCANSSGNDWPISRHDSAQTGFSSSKAPKSTIVQLWNFTIETSTLSAPRSPAVVNERVYVCSDDYGVCCFEASDGTKVWSFKPEAEMDFYYSPTVIDGRVYSGSDNGQVYCIDASSGNKLWNFSVGSYELWTTVGIPVSSSVNIAEGRAYLGALSGTLYCLDAASGERLWQFSTGTREAENNYVSHPTSPAISSDGYCYVNNVNGDIFCLNATSGAIVWNGTVEARVSADVVVEGFIYFGASDGNVYCLDASSGTKIWNYTTWYNAAGPAHNYQWGNSVSDPAVAYGHVYVGSTDFDVFCLDALTGEEIWSFSTGGIANPPSVAGGCVFAGSYDGNLYCLDAYSGVEIWRVAAGVPSPVNAGGSAGSPSVAAGVVYAVGNGVLSAWGTSSPNPQSTPTATPEHTPEPISTTLVITIVILVAIGTIALIVVIGAGLLVYFRKNRRDKDL